VNTVKKFRSCRVGATLFLAVAFAGIVQAGTIGQWDGSWTDANGVPTTWNNSTFFSSMYALQLAAGNTVAPDGGATASVLAAFDSFVIAGPGRAPTSDEISALWSFVTLGGLLMLFEDQNPDTHQYANTLLTGVGSSIQVGAGTMTQNMYLVDVCFATSGLGGRFVSGTPGRRITGGTTLTTGGADWTAGQIADAEAYLHYEQIGLGYVFVFGDRFDHNFFDFSPGTVRAELFTNLGSYEKPTSDPSGVPEPSSLVLLGTGLAFAALMRRRGIGTSSAKTGLVPWCQGRSKK
jgi:hypothetical protein